MDLLSFVIGAISGVVSSLLFWLGQYLLRPRMVSASEAVLNERLSIKVKNCTLCRPLYDLNAALYLVTHPQGPDGATYANHDQIALKHSTILELRKKDSANRNGAWIFVSKDKVDSSLTDGDYFRLRISAADGWFNLRRVFTFDYPTTAIVPKGRYESGRSLKISSSPS